MVFLMSFYLAQSQTLKFSKSTSIPFKDKISDRTMGFRAAGVINGTTYLIHLPYSEVTGEKAIGMKSSYYISAYDENLKLVKKDKIDLTHKENKLNFEGLFVINGKLVLFVSFQNTKIKKHFLFSRYLNPETLKPEGDMKLVGELDYSGHNRYNNTLFTFELSDDESRILVFHTFVSRNDEVIKFGLFVFDESLNMLWKNENINPRHAEGIFSYEKFKVDNNGEVYLLGKHYADRENYFDEGSFQRRNIRYREVLYADKPNYTYHIYHFTKSGQSENYARIQLPDMFIRSLNFTVENSGEILCHGIYSKPGTISAKGAFLFKYDISTKEAKALSKAEFSTSMIEQGFKDKEMSRFQRSMKSRSEWDPFNYLLTDLADRDNGGKYFIAEQHMTGKKHESQGNTTVTHRIHMHYDLFVVFVDPEMKSLTAHRVEKRQYFLNTIYFNSFFVDERGEDLCFIYNNLPRQEKYKNKTILGETIVARLSGVGKIEKSYVHRELTPKKPMMITNTIAKSGEKSYMYAKIAPNYKIYNFEKIDIQ